MGWGAHCISSLGRTDPVLTWDLMPDIRHILKQVVLNESEKHLFEFALVVALLPLGAVASMKTLFTQIGAAFLTKDAALASDISPLPRVADRTPAPNTRTS